MEVVRGIHLIRVPIPASDLGFINVYVVEGEGGNLMVDTGWNTPEAFNALKDGLKEAGFAFKDITQIVVTHIHPDHIGLAGKMTQLSGAKLALHEAEFGLIDSRYSNTNRLVQELEHYLKRNGVPPREVAAMQKVTLDAKQFVEVGPVERKLKGGDTITVDSLEFEVLHTPGHSIGHICLYEPTKKILFSGDHLLAAETPYIGLHPQSGENPLADFLKSMETIHELEVNFVFAGHGPVFSGHRRRIGEIAYHHEQRKKAIVRTIAGEMKTAYEIATVIPWHPERGGVAYRDLPLLDQRLAVLETLAHLRLLISEGEVDKVTEKDKVVFFAGG